MLRTPVKMENVLREVIKEMESDLKGREIAWKIGPLPEVIGDRSMLKQVWANLLGNAVKYSRGRERAEIEIQCARKSPAEWEFSVRDNGAGFNMQYVSKLFGVFQRLHTEREFEGMGIGLANVRRIIQRHGGTTRAEGEVDRGATIYFTLPV
jgi:light-regulated signal transduction histidine kinase (bacteriophytochrome)